MNTILSLDVYLAGMYDEDRLITSPVVHISAPHCHSKQVSCASQLFIGKDGEQIQTMAVDSEEFRLAMRHWATGVTVVATEYQGVRHGMTVNAFTSIALTPPLLLVSLEIGARTHGLVKKAGFFGLTILSRNQEEISECFAGRHTEGEDRFSNLETLTLSTGAPFLAGGLAYFDCRVVSTYDVSTHTLFISEVVALLNQPYDGINLPLIYHQQTYKGLQK